MRKCNQDRQCICGTSLYQGSEAELIVLAEFAKKAAERAGASIDEALSFIEASNLRIRTMEQGVAILGLPTTTPSS